MEWLIAALREPAVQVVQFVAAALAAELARRAARRAGEAQREVAQQRAAPRRKRSASSSSTRQQTPSQGRLPLPRRSRKSETSPASNEAV